MPSGALGRFLPEDFAATLRGLNATERAPLAFLHQYDLAHGVAVSRGVRHALVIRLEPQEEVGWCGRGKPMWYSHEAQGTARVMKPGASVRRVGDREPNYGNSEAMLESRRRITRRQPHTYTLV